jgi:hypothetical protein
MNAELKKVADHLQNSIDLIPAKFLKYSEEELRRKPAPNKWSKKEILGHLIDSAANNHHRFVKSQFEGNPYFVNSYAQDNWVKSQKPNDINSKFLVEFWKMYNMHLHWIMVNYPEEKLAVKCKAEDVTELKENILLLMKDYVDHMDHHLEQIFN